jgi:hypothetical protein
VTLVWLASFGICCQASAGESGPSKKVSGPPAFLAETTWETGLAAWSDVCGCSCPWKPSARLLPINEPQSMFRDPYYVNNAPRPDRTPGKSRSETISASSSTRALVSIYTGDQCQ